MLFCCLGFKAYTPQKLPSVTSLSASAFDEGLQAKVHDASYRVTSTPRVGMSFAEDTDSSKSQDLYSDVSLEEGERLVCKMFMQKSEISEIINITVQLT